jgi:hypothetical protein
MQIQSGRTVPLKDNCLLLFYKYFWQFCTSGFDKKGFGSQDVQDRLCKNQLVTLINLLIQDVTVTYSASTEVEATKIILTKVFSFICQYF